MKDAMLRAAVVSASKRATAEGLLIEVGWLSLRLMTMPDDPDPVRLEECRMAFFAGAQHVFGSLLTIMDEDREPTDADLAKMGQISDELDRFIVDFKRKHGIDLP
jgi:hypothetical protein